MSVSTQPQFYAFIFMPYCFKPVYAVAANALGKHRRIDKRSRACLLQICGMLSGLLYLSVALVRTIPGAFAVFFCINLAGACSELMLGSYLMELAHQDLRNAGAVQSPAICHKFEGNFDEMEEGISLGTVINLLFKGYLVK